MIEFVPATGEHIKTVALRMRDRDLAEFSALTFYDTREDAADVLVARYADAPGVTCALLDGKPVAIGGVVWSRPNVASLLFYATDDYGKIVIPLTRHVRSELRVAKAYASRIDCFSLSTYAEMRQWVELFGLRKEATLRRYGKRGEDFIVYAWLPKRHRAGKPD